jgi:hypothetical protein
MNALFEYCYRHAGNWKRYGEIVFRGSPTEALRERLGRALHDREWFIASQLRVREIFFEAVDAEDDHCWHELAGLSETEEEPTDPLGRSIESFVEEVERVASDGWKEFARSPVAAS